MMRSVPKPLLVSFVAAAISVALMVSPVYADEGGHIDEERSIENYHHDRDSHEDDESVVTRDGYDERFRQSCHPPVSFSEVPNLAIDSALITATPHWMFLATGEGEQQALLQYLNNADVPVKTRTKWKQFLRGIWKKYPVKYVRSKSSAILKLGNSHKKYTLTPRENDAFREIEAYIAQDMEKTRQNIILPMWARPTHASFAKNSIIQTGAIDKDEQYYSSLVDGSAREPDGWYENDPIPYAHQINHGFVPVGITMMPLPFIILPPQIVGVGLAPDNYGKYAFLAKQEFASRNYNDAFKDMAYASHFISDLGNPYHTPMVQIIPLEFIDMPYFLIVNIGMILDYESLHNNYEKYVDDNFVSFGAPAEIYAPIDPAYSAKGHAVFSWAMSYPLVYSCYWHYIRNHNFDFKTNPAIVSIAQNRVTETAKHNNGLVQYVTGGKPITFTITPTTSPGGSISPPNPVTINYGQSQTYVIQPELNYDIDEVFVNGVSIGKQIQFTFNTETLNKAIGDQTIDVIFESTAPPQPSPSEWIWSQKGWDDWQHTASWSGYQVGPNSEYGPVMVNNHGEHGTNTNLDGGKTQASVWRTFSDASGTGWNTLTFKGLLSASDVPEGRWMKMEVNGKQVYFATAANRPPGNHEPFEIQVQFPHTATPTVKISHGQNPAWGPIFYMEFESLRLSLETEPQVTALTNPPEIPQEEVVVTNLTGNKPSPTG